MIQCNAYRNNKKNQDNKQTDHFRPRFVELVLLNNFLQKMCSIKPEDIERAIEEVVKKLNGIDSLYPGQHEIILSLFHSDNIFFTSSTNSGKTLPAVIYPEILKYLGGMVQLLLLTNCFLTCLRF